MSECLITKLKGVVSDTSLKKMGEIRLGISKVSNPTEFTQGFMLHFIEETLISIVGDGYFTDSTLSENKGKTLLVSPHFDTTIYVSNGDFEISIPKKYKLKKINDFGRSASGNDYGFKNKFIPLDELSYCKELINIYLLNSEFSGNIDNLKNLPNLARVIVSNTNGNINSLQSLQELSYITFINSNVEGDLAKLPAKCYFFSLAGNNTNLLTWSERPSTSNIFATEGNIVVRNVDKMLNDLAACVAAIPVSGESWYKKINILGNRTSSSDSAVATLQNKGYTVSVTPA